MEKDSRPPGPERPDDFQAELLPLFQVEVEEHLATLNRDLLALEADPQTPQREALLKEVFRAAHSLKGAARMLGFEDIQVIAHRMEDLIAALQSGELALTPAHCDLLLNASDLIQSTQAARLQGLASPAEDIQPGLDALSAALNTGLARGAPACEPSAQSALPPAAPPASDAPRPDAPARRPLAHEETIRVATSKLDGLMEGVGELLIVRMRAEQIRAETRRLRDQCARWQKSWRKARPAFNRLAKRASAAAPCSQSPDAQALFQFLTENERQMKTLHSDLDALLTCIAEDTDHLQLVSEQLQIDARRARMLPIASLFDYFTRTLRDLAREQGKQASLQIEGAETEVDRQVLELAKDPLTHLLRNALDHGIEPPGVREAAGKPPQGLIRLRAEQRGNNILLEVADDGAGIDLGAIRKSAVAKNLLTEAAAANLGEAETLELIFQPGFSTASQVSELSGRGVGLDVVRKNVEQLRGTVRATTTPGQGASFQLLFPLTLAASQVILVKASDQILAAPMLNVERILKIPAGQVNSIEGKAFILYEGRAMPLVSLGGLLGLPQSELRLPAGAKICVLILQALEKRVALHVDAFLEAQEIMIKNLGRQLRRVRNVAGVAILGDGRLAIVLNCADLVKTVFSGQALPASPLILAEAAAVESPERRRLLIADDSITTRALQKHILEKSGYEVLAVGDGAQAWGLLQREVVDLVITDIDMPNMDGFELTAAIKANPATARLPVILVTSLGGEEDRLRGMNAGAEAYIVKSSFDQNQLLDAIRRAIR